MAKSQWTFRPSVWGAPESEKERADRNDRGGVLFEVRTPESDEHVAMLSLDWMKQPDRLGATVEFSLHSWAEDGDIHAFPSWMASGRLAPRPGGVAITQLAVTPDAPWFQGASLEEEKDYALNFGDPPPKNWMPEGGGITSGLLRKLPLGIVYAGVQALAHGADTSPDLEWFLAHIAQDYPDWRKAIEETAGGSHRGTQQEKARSGRPKTPDEFLREVALAYLELSGTRGAHALLGKRFDKSENAIKEAIRVARREGWLAPGQAGRRGAYPGPRLLAERATESDGGND
ncbi:hypothetical protein [Streptomyces sp. NPDC047028]|uniref:hypothetical protein n=1 Tax=Streptomyces sp. NPDC047028 TaxID=3155793 RepID=UPI003408B391